MTSFNRAAPPSSLASRRAPLARAEVAPGELDRRRTMSRLAALGAVAGLAVIGPLVEAALGGGRGFAIGFVIMVLAPSFMRAGGPRFHPLDPETFVPFMYFLSAGYAPCLHILLSKYFLLSYLEVNAFEIAYMGAVGCALVCAGLSRAPKDPSVKAWGLPPRILPRDWAVIMTGFAGTALVGAWVLSTGVSTLMAASYAETYQHEDGKGVLIAGWFFIQLAIVHCVARMADFRRIGAKIPRLLVIATAVMLIAFLMNTLLGRRGPFLWVMISIGLCLHVSGMKIRRSWMVGAVAFTLVYAFAIEGYRTELGQSTSSKLNAARASIERIDNPFVLQELEGVFDNLATVVEQKPPILYYPGESWVNAFLILIPKPLWSDRPTSLSERYVQWGAPGFAREGGGFAFNATAEGFVNMGAPGAILEVSAFALAFFFFPLALCVGKPRGPLFRALAACLSSFTYNQYRGELTSMLKIAVSFVIAAGFVHLASSVLLQVQDRFLKRPVRHMRDRLGFAGARAEVESEQGAAS